MRPGTLLAAALVALALSCAQQAVQYRDSYTRVVVHNHQWQDATVDIYCGSELRARVRVTGSNKVTRHVGLTPCVGGLMVEARFLAGGYTMDGQRRVRRSEREYGLGAGTYVTITLPQGLDWIAVAFYPERER
jgi:hypothetical protein